MPLTITSRATQTATAGQNGGQESSWIAFAGAGTTLKVAAQLRRDYIGIELSREYIDKIATPRLTAVETGVPVAEQQAGQKGLFEEVR